MKIIFVIPNMTGGGAERVISILANYFVDSGIITKILMTAGNECSYDLDSRVELFQAGEKTGGSVFKRLNRIFCMRKYFKQNRDGILICFEPDVAFFSSIAKIGLHIPMISSERNDPVSFGNDRVKKIAYHYSDRIVFQTREAQEYFSKKVQKKGQIIANPVRTNLPEPHKGERKKTIVCVGRLEPQKNHKLLLLAFAAVNKQHPEYVLHIYGRGSLENELKQLASQLSISKTVIFEGFRKDVLTDIIDAGMFVLSSDYEGMSNSLLEAMAVGLPVISTDCPCGGSRLCISNGENGYLVPVKDVDALATAMLTIIEKPEKGQKMGQEASRIRNTFSVKTIAEQWIKILNEIEK